MEAWTVVGKRRVDDPCPGQVPEGVAEPVAWMRDRLLSLCAVDTTTGREDDGLPVLQALLEELGARVELQRVVNGRHNVLARWGEPRVLFSTHLDTVPPYLPPRLEAGPDGVVVHGRGTVDAKGQVVAQLAAVRALLQAGRPDVAWLGVVGEETDSVGAHMALALRDGLRGCRLVIDGEPTDGRLATGQRGVTQLVLRCRGVAAHSGTPERGRSAIWDLLDWLGRLRSLPGGADAQLGEEAWNVGLIRGGEALNVVPAHAEASVMLRCVPGSRFVEQARALAPAGGSLQVLGETPPDRFPQVPGFPLAAVPFGSDAPVLRGLAEGRRVILAGPGRIERAHADDERIALDELASGRELNLALACTELGDATATARATATTVGAKTARRAEPIDGQRTGEPAGGAGADVRSRTERARRAGAPAEGA